MLEICYLFKHTSEHLFENVLKFCFYSAVVGFVVVLLHRQRNVVLRRVFLLAAILYGLRAVVLAVTFLPPSFSNRDEICLPQVNRSTMYATEIATRLHFCRFFWLNVYLQTGRAFIRYNGPLTKHLVLVAIFGCYKRQNLFLFEQKLTLCR